MAESSRLFSIFFLSLFFFFFFPPFFFHSPGSDLGCQMCSARDRRAMPFPGCCPRAALRECCRDPAGGAARLGPASSGFPNTVRCTGTPKTSVTAAGKSWKKLGLAKPPKYALRRGSSVSRAPSALRWLRCLQRQLVQARRALCSSHPADTIATPPDSRQFGFFGLCPPFSSSNRGIPSHREGNRWEMGVRWALLPSGVRWGLSTPWRREERTPPSRRCQRSLDTERRRSFRCGRAPPSAAVSAHTAGSPGNQTAIKT